MRAINGFCLALLVVLLPVGAAALSQSKHRGISYSACSKQKLPNEFCQSVGAASYNVDHYEWDDLAAHAQPEAGESKCVAAQKTVARVAKLGAEVRGLGQAATVYDPELAVALGRVLHTVQDNCAHGGMPNIQHAWASVSDSCTETKSSPDVQPEAVLCAEQETELVLSVFAAKFKVPDPPVNTEGPAQQDPQFFPSRGGVCDFLKSATGWDGVDRRWNGPLVVAAVRDQLTASLAGDAPLNDVCAGGETALEPVASPAVTDVSHPTEWCTLLKVYCAGKTDDESAAPPWEEGEPAANAGASEAEAGCSVRAMSDRRGVAALGLALVLLFRRRRVAPR